MARDERGGVLVPKGLGGKGADAGARAPSHALQQEEAAEAVARLRLRVASAGAASERAAVARRSGHARDGERMVPHNSAPLAARPQICPPKSEGLARCTRAPSCFPTRSAASGRHRKGEQREEPLLRR